MTTPLLKFWFSNEFPTSASQLPKAFAQMARLWFASTPEMDAECRDLFAADLAKELPDATPMERLSNIILLDQIPRNIYRNTPQAFAYDHLALKKALDAIDRKWDLEIPPLARMFVYLPLEHSENMQMQQLSLQKFTQLASEMTGEMAGFAQKLIHYAQDHHQTIEKFQRFPHRNSILNRENTAEESEFLKSLGDQLYGVSIKK
jgi:uncharacterized protein (DUF924 family)